MKQHRKKFDFAPATPWVIGLPGDGDFEPRSELGADAAGPVLSPETAPTVLKIAFDRLLAASDSGRHPASDRRLWRLVGAMALGFDPDGLRAVPDPRWARAMQMQLERYWRTLNSPKQRRKRKWLTARIFFEQHRKCAAKLACWFRKKGVRGPHEPQSKTATALRTEFDRAFPVERRCNCLGELFPKVLSQIETNRAESEVAACAIAKHFRIAKGKLTQLSP